MLLLQYARNHSATVIDGRDVGTNPSHMHLRGDSCATDRQWHLHELPNCGLHSTEAILRERK